VVLIDKPGKMMGVFLKLTTLKIYIVIVWFVGFSFCISMKVVRIQKPNLIPTLYLFIEDKD
jgi:hypothetical protein